MATGDLQHTRILTGDWTGLRLPCPACAAMPLQPPFTFTPVVASWECIRCHRINAPHVTQCDCPPVITLTVGVGAAG